MSPERDTGYTPVRDATESQMCALWSTILSIPVVAPDDEFIRLGGDSLLALEILAACQRTWRVRIPLSAFFATPTPAALARRIDAGDFEVGPRDQSFVPAF